MSGADDQPGGDPGGHRPPVSAVGVRIGWPDLPAHVRAWVEELLEGTVVSARSQGGGFSPGTADRLLTSAGRRGFLKAVSSDQNDRTPDLHRREARVAGLLPPDPRIPRLVGHLDDGHWVALLFEDVPGRTPEVPWEARDVAAAMRTLGELAERLTPSPTPELGSLVDELREPFGGWARIRAQPPAGLDPWVAGRLDQLVALAADGLDALGGDTVVHADVRADNLLVGPDGAVSVVDWPYACRGAAWVDRLLLVVDVDLGGGHDAEALAATYLDGLVEPAAVTGTLAGLCGYFGDAARRPPPRGLPSLRAFQAVEYASTLAWLRRRLADAG